MDTASNYIVAVKGDETYVYAIESFAYGPEETVEQVAAKITAKLEPQGFECKLVPVLPGELLD